ncbi:trichothecene biosynthesis acetyltransferase [Coleophoma cylindrospora]|uniref:Trichothecene biosynthesis acetyltransferase n=1 Tax=Coleophoma cylindrospora TaxID=1849047 RepID=A0A3D8RIA9_9HELO|nr:trichothecene biosynthesis acetyltransferase [Coleophoma cylindrospora]
MAQWEETYRCQPSDVSVRGAKDFPLTGCDQLMRWVHVRTTVYYPLSNSTKISRGNIVQLLKSGLEKLASQLPCLTATLVLDPVSKRGTASTIGSDDGILFLVAGSDTVRTDLPSYAELERGRFAPWKVPRSKIYPDDNGKSLIASQGQDSALPASIFQLSFIEGGLILTGGFHHFVVDGPSMDLIFRAWAAHCQGHTVPLHTDRSFLLSSKKPDLSELVELERALTARGCKVESTKPDPNNPWSNLRMAPTKSAIISLSHKRITALKAEIIAQEPSTPVSTSDCLHAICWTGVTRAKAALAENEEEKDSWTNFPITFRSRRIPEFPKNFIGNSTFLNGAVLPIEKLKAPDGPHYAALALRRLIENVDAAYLADGITWVNSLEKPATLSWVTNPPGKMDTLFTSWAGLTPYQNWDFGFGLPTALRAPEPIIPLVFLLPAKTNADGEISLEVHMACTEETHKLLMKDTEFLRYTTDYYLED